MGSGRDSVTARSSVTRCQTKKLPNFPKNLCKQQPIASFYFKSDVLQTGPKRYQLLGLLLQQNLQPRTFKNRPIWSLWPGVIFVQKVLFNKNIFLFCEQGLAYRQLGLKSLTEAIHTKSDNKNKDLKLLQKYFKSIF